MNHKGTVTLETERLILRRFELSDSEAMFCNSLSDPKVPTYMTWNVYEDIGSVRNYIMSVMNGYKNLSHYHWVIVVKELGEPIGSIGVTRYNNETRCVDIGYSIGSKWWHQGYTSEALQRLVCFFFDEVDANRIEAQHDTRNSNSGKVMQKAGLRYEGTFRQSEHNNQGIHDSAHYAILAEDYFSSKSNSQKLTFKPYDLVTDREFLIAAHKETFKLTFKIDIKQEWLDAELSKRRDVRDGAYLDGKLIGVCDLQRRSKDGCDFGKVNFYYIVPEYRNRGYGAQLIAHSVDWCRNQGLKTLTLNTGKENLQAQKCYENNGFIRFSQIDTDDEFGYVKRIDNPNADTIKTSTELMFHNLKIAMDTVDWNADICGAPAWRYVYHTIHSADKYFINPNQYTEPTFHTPKLDWSDTPSDVILSKETLYGYYEQVKKKILEYVNRLDDTALCEISEGCKSTRFGLIVSQFRHMYAHIGIFNGITIAKDNKYPRVINESTWLSANLPEGLYDVEER